jgi:glycosyltransferase involved in cell wall biosynthesis
VLSVGAIQPRKGFDFLIESLGCLTRASRPSLRLVGNVEVPGYRQFLEDLAERHQVHLAIEVGVAQDTLVGRYNEAAVFAYAPLNEPFGLAPLEAMACGTPVVGVAEGGVRESVADGEGGRLVQRDRKRFAEAIAGLLQEPSTLAEYGRTAREYVMKRWTWEASVLCLEQYLEAAATGSSVGDQRLAPQAIADSYLHRAAHSGARRKG